MTPEEFVARCESACADLALYFAGAPDEVFEIALQDFGKGVREKLTKRYSRWIAPEKIASVVETIQDDVRSRRQEIEAPTAGISSFGC